MSQRLSALAPLFALLLAVVAPGMAAAAPASSPYATVNVTFLACPPGGDWTAPPAGCAEVVDAPDHAMVTFGAGQAAPVTSFPRNADGSYTIPYPQPVDGAANMGFVNFFPDDYNAYTFTGVDTLLRWYGAVDLAQGETRDVTVSYWNGPVDLITPAENSLTVNVWACGEGADPAVDVSPCAPMDADMPGLTIAPPPLRGIDMADYLTRQGGTFRYDGLPAYTQAQVTVDLATSGFGTATISGDAEEITADSATAFLLRGEARTIDVYLSDPQSPQEGGATWTRNPTPTTAPEAGTGTLRLLFFQCPADVIPHDDPGACAETLAAGPGVMVASGDSGEQVPLSSFERDTTGAYLVTGVEGSVTISGVAPGEGRRLATDADQIGTDEITYTVDDGETRDGRLYYYDVN